MVLSDEKKRGYVRRLLLSRMRLLIKNGFYGLLLMHISFALDDSCKTAGTDGKRIIFSPAFLDELSDSELDFVLMHEILHVVLQHCFRRGDREAERVNAACDIVVNSNILRSNDMDINSITLKKYGESMHIAPDGKEGYEYTAEQVYDMLAALKGNASGPSKQKGASASGTSKQGGGNSKCGQGAFDDHSHWDNESDDNALRDAWTKHLMDACEAIEIRDSSVTYGGPPLGAIRMLKELRRPQTDWRTILNGFVQEEINDYSFTPPDRRFDESPFFLPDFNEKEDRVGDILFMIDTSGSMSDDMITAAYSEVKGAIDQFDGKLKGWLGFFDAEIIEPQPFETEDELRVIRPKGGGGTDFHIIFEYVRQNMQDRLPTSIIILTDGYAPFPDEAQAMGIPVLWLLNNDDAEPPWGKIARISVERYAQKAEHQL